MEYTYAYEPSPINLISSRRMLCNIAKFIAILSSNDDIICRYKYDIIDTYLY